MRHDTYATGRNEVRSLRRAPPPLPPNAQPSRATPGADREALVVLMARGQTDAGIDAEVVEIHPRMDRIDDVLADLVCCLAR